MDYGDPDSFMWGWCPFTNGANLENCDWELDAWDLPKAIISQIGGLFNGDFHPMVQGNKNHQKGSKSKDARMPHIENHHHHTSLAFRLASFNSNLEIFSQMVLRGSGYLVTGYM